jgi:hypothetical protein
MTKTVILISAVFILILLIIILFWMIIRRKRHTSYTYPQTLYGVWDASVPSFYSCKETESMTPGYCILQKDKAEQHCSSDPKCVGYIHPQSADNPWWDLYENKVQLVGQTPHISTKIPGYFYQKMAGH